METALCLLYLIMGCWSIGYIKHDFLGWTTFTTSLGSYYISNMALGFCFGFLTIPFALLHIITHAGFFQKIVRYKEEYKRKQRKQ